MLNAVFSLISFLHICCTTKRTHIPPLTRQSHHERGAVKGLRGAGMETPARTHTLIACEKLHGGGRLFVCLRRRCRCVYETTAPRALPPRLLIPPAQMKCNGADSIRALPPRENAWNQITPSPLRAFPALTAAGEGERSNGG